MNPMRLTSPLDMGVAEQHVGPTRMTRWDYAVHVSEGLFMPRADDVAPNGIGQLHVPNLNHVRRAGEGG
jgi:hypothetical protein